ncbi:outer membrane beta-barrel protein [Deminuibacter soli]|uniref:Outer membrane protein beta-barrel domain-containing protein n=1 Tax=Deminuibacter soli TaxID=2291815 RepID=A0A3E1NLG8_9BACT|nr:outer membrane beta-barrel protein [Deminuibacter soli]RFM28779.1 hypothetical protein DXN05_08345 [Deminuibacter soli]
MTDQLFDKFIRDKLGDHPSPVPADMWDRIAAGEKRRTGPAWLRAPAVYLWLAALLLLTGSATWLWVQQTPGSTANQTQTSPNLKPGLSGKNFTQPPTQQNAAAAGTDSTTEPATAGSSNTAVQTPADHTIANKTVDATRSSANTAAATIGSENEAANIATGHAAGNGTHLPRNGNGLYNNGVATGNQLTTAPLNDAPNTAFSTTQFLNSRFVPAYNTDTKTAQLQWLQASQDASMKSLLSKQANKKMPVIQCPTLRGPFRNDFYVELYGSPDFVSKSISPSSPAYAGYVQRKDSAENMRVSFTLGARFSKSLSEHLLAKAGLQYSQINERLTTQTETDRKTVTVITTHTIVPTPGDTLIVKDTSSYEQIGYRKKTTTNKYKSIDIPLLLSYEWGNDQWKFAANAGAIINLYSWYRGEVLDTSIQNHGVAQGTYKRNIGLGVYAGFSVMKTITDNMELFAEPYLRYNFSNMTQPGTPYNQKFKTTGLSLGIRYRLNNAGQRFMR